MIDLHEHQMIPDHAIPPYAWHYKCAVEGCGYETDSFKVPDDKDVENARLRAEVERLKAILAGSLTPAELRIRCDKAERERDEALAQVAVLLQRLREEHCQSETCDLHAAPYSEARVLLDRLQRAEAENDAP